MNDSSSTNGSRSRIPSDERMDALLHDFFRLEIPVELNQPFRAVPVVGVSPVRLSVESERRSVPLRSRPARIMTIAVAVVAMGLAVAILVSSSSPQPARNSVVTDIKSEDSSVPELIDRPMLVSPQGDSRKSPGIIGPDGVTLEETDSIDLHPRK